MEDNFQQEIERQSQRKLDSRTQGPLRELVVFGAVGWSIALPTTLGVLLGVWLDKQWPGTHSWTLVGLGAGLTMGLVNAWTWIKENSI